jgi:hypothetical protein
MQKLNTESTDFMHPRSYIAAPKKELKIKIKNGGEILSLDSRPTQLNHKPILFGATVLLKYRYTARKQDRACQQSRSFG